MRTSMGVDERPGGLSRRLDSADGISGSPGHALDGGSSAWHGYPGPGRRQPPAGKYALLTADAPLTGVVSSFCWVIQLE
jgi:hypothetical protein